MLCVKIIRWHKKEGLFCSLGTSGKRSSHTILKASKFENVRFAFQSDRKRFENGTFEKKCDVFSNISGLAWTKKPISTENDSSFFITSALKCT